MHEMACYHFELNMLGYGAFMTFSDFCKTAFPDIPDQSIARMVGGVDILFFRPDDEVRKLSRLAIELGLADAVLDNDDPDEVLRAMGAAEGGDRWLAALEEAKDPWFWFSTGTGYCHQHRSWIDDLTVPFGAMQGYVTKLQAGESIDRPLDEILRERERIAAEYRELLPTDDDRTAFDETLALARKVYPYVENHNFYVEHWHHSMFWNKVRELGRVFQAGGFLVDYEDIFYLHRYEVHEALFDMLTAWATTNPGPPPLLAGRDRRAQADHGEAARVGAAAGARQAAGGRDRGGHGDAVGHHHRHGRAVARRPGRRRRRRRRDRPRSTASRPRRAWPRARRGSSPPWTSSTRCELGEILVCPITAPSWAPVFARDRRRGLGRRRDHVPRRHRLARVRPARRRRHRLRHAGRSRPASACASTANDGRRHRARRMNAAVAHHPSGSRSATRPAPGGRRQVRAASAS